MRGASEKGSPSRAFMAALAQYLMQNEPCFGSPVQGAADHVMQTGTRRMP
jgi:hypothetical protein